MPASRTLFLVLFFLFPTATVEQTIFPYESESYFDYDVEDSFASPPVTPPPILVPPIPVPATPSPVVTGLSSTSMTAAFDSTNSPVATTVATNSPAFTTISTAAPAMVMSTFAPFGSTTVAPVDAATFAPVGFPEPPSPAPATTPQFSTFPPMFYTFPVESTLAPALALDEPVRPTSAPVAWTVPRVGDTTSPVGLTTSPVGTTLPPVFTRTTPAPTFAGAFAMTTTAPVVTGVSTSAGYRPTYFTSDGDGGYGGYDEGGTSDRTSSTVNLPDPPPGRDTSTSTSSSTGYMASDQENLVFCDAEGASADYSEKLMGDGVSMERVVASATGCPNHVNWNINGNAAREVSSNTTIPAHPMLMGDGRTTPLNQTVGAIGILFNGVALYSSAWLNGTSADSYETSAFYGESDTFDLCGGVAAEDGEYHYHNTAGCLQEQASLAAVATGWTMTHGHSPQLGWSFDGFPVYGQLGPVGTEMKMCGQEGAHAFFCLDMCSGFEAEIAGVDGFKYRYYTSCGYDESFFPFTTNCYRGCCPDGMMCGEYVEDCDASASLEVGFTANYTAQASQSLAEQFNDSALIEGDDNAFVGSDTSLDCSLYMGSASGGGPGDGTDGPTGGPLGSDSMWGTTGGPTSAPTSSPTTGITSAPTTEGHLDNTPSPAGITVPRNEEISAASGAKYFSFASSSPLLAVAFFWSVLATTVAMIAGFSESNT